MRGIRTKIGAACAGVAMVTAIPAQASSCWAAREVDAARVRQMQTMLMVAALRCRAAGIDIAADYAGFVTAQRDAITAANLAIKDHFAGAGGNQADYDRFATSLANGFGDDETSQATCAEASAIAHDGAAASGSVALLQVASARVFPAALPGGACDAPPAAMTMAAATPVVAPKPAEAPAPIIMLAAAPAAEPAPVTLPGDVVAALTVLAHYRTAPAAGAQTAAPATQIAVLAR